MATQSSSAKWLRLNTSFNAAWRRWNTSTAAAPTSWAVTRCAGVANTSATTRGISLSDTECASRLNSICTTVNSDAAYPIAKTIHGSASGTVGLTMDCTDVTYSSNATAAMNNENASTRPR